MPEIISHFSDYWFISIRELGNWLQKHKDYESFSEMYNQVYENKFDFSDEDIEMLRKDGFIL